MSVQIENLDTASIVALPQRLAMANAAALREAITHHLEKESQHVVLDLAAVEYVDSSGLSVLVSALKRARALGGEAVLLNVSEQVMALILLTRLHEVFGIYKTRDAALAGVREAREVA